MKKLGFTVLLSGMLGCTVVTSTVVKPTDTEVDGILYHLPKSFIKVGLQNQKDDAGKKSELIITTGAEIVPDPSARLSLNSSVNDLFSSNHTFNVTNGLLTTVATDDEGKSGGMITSLTTAGINIAKIAAMGAFGESLEPDTDQVPSEGEKATALSSIAFGHQEFLFNLIKGEQLVTVPGTANLVVLTAEILWLPDNLPTIDNLKPFGGVATRVLSPCPVKVDLFIDKKVLFEKRIRAAINIIEDSVAQIEAGEAKRSRLMEKLKVTAPGSTEANELNSELKAVEKSLDDFTNSKGKAERSIKKNTALLKDLPDRAWFNLASQPSLVMVPDFSPTVKIPLTRAMLGNTKQTITLDHGVFTNIHEEMPSSTFEIVKIPGNITEQILKYPAEIFQLKIDYSTKKKELVEAESKYQESLKSLNDKLASPTEQQQKVTTLEQEKALLQLQKDIATLKAAIAELEKGK